MAEPKLLVCPNFVIGVCDLCSEAAAVKIAVGPVNVEGGMSATGADDVGWAAGSVEDHVSAKPFDVDWPESRSWDRSLCVSGCYSVISAWAEPACAELDEARSAMALALNCFAPSVIVKDVDFEPRAWIGNLIWCPVVLDSSEHAVGYCVPCCWCQFVCVVACDDAFGGHRGVPFGLTRRVRQVVSLIALTVRIRVLN